MEKRIDLHTHSSESDGTFSPKELIALAKEKELFAIALTDHDTIGGLKNARLAAEQSNIEFISGIELSTDYNGTEVHILGLLIDEENPQFLSTLQNFIDARNERNEKMAFLLRQEGFTISMEALNQAYPNSVITRAHFARYLTEHGYVKDRKTVFDKYLGDNCRCYVPREKITPFEAIRLIHLSGGLAFFAHPVLCHMTADQLRFFVKNLKNAGLDGLEAIYSRNNALDEHHMKKLATEFDLLISGGSDFHGDNKPDIQLGSGLGNLCISYEILEKIKNFYKKL